MRYAGLDAEQPREHVVSHVRNGASRVAACRVRAQIEMEDSMPYVDGFILPLPKNNIDKYREIASKAGAVWREYGALEYHECIADDVKPGEVTSFPQSVLLEPNETTVFAWIVYKSREHRDEVLAKVLADPRMKSSDMPFDAKRMIYGGFQSIVDL
jgi:uncharacterized protein YbaA (DUF1428 family)